jgi:hypothetical protein
MGRPPTSVFLTSEVGFDIRNLTIFDRMERGDSS